MGTTLGSNGCNLELLRRIEVLSAENTELKSSNSELKEALAGLSNSVSGLSEKVTMRRFNKSSIAEGLREETPKADVFGVAAFYNVVDSPPEVPIGYLFWIKSSMLTNALLLIAVSTNVSKVQKLFFGSLAPNADAAVWYES